MANRALNVGYGMTPPAIVQAENAKTLIAKAKALYQGIRQDELNVREKWIRLGTILNTIQERSTQDEFLKAREEMGISRQRASDCQRAAQLPEATLRKCEDWNDCREAIKDLPSPSCPPRGQDGQTESQIREPGDDTEVEEAQKDTSKSEPKRTASGGDPQTIREHNPEGKPNLPKDALGHALPVHLIPAFAAVERFEEIDSSLRKIQKDTDELVRGPGGEQLARCVKAHGNEEKLSYRLEELEAVKRHVKFTRPYSVCPFCSGNGNKSCKGCAGTGWVTKTTWDGTDEKTRGKLCTS